MGFLGLQKQKSIAILQGSVAILLTIGIATGLTQHIDQTLRSVEILIYLDLFAVSSLWKGKCKL